MTFVPSRPGGIMLCAACYNLQRSKVLTDNTHEAKQNPKDDCDFQFLFLVSALCISPSVLFQWIYLTVFE